MTLAVLKMNILENDIPKLFFSLSQLVQPIETTILQEHTELPNKKHLA